MSECYTKRKRAGSDMDEKTPEKKAHTLLQLSQEQHEVVTNITQRKNVLVIAKAGSGKSSVALAAAERFYQEHKQRTLLITYNARLKEETRERITKLGLNVAVEAHSYHAVAGKYFVSIEGTADNSLIHRALRGPPKEEMNFGMVVLDEAQDMNALYCRFIKHLLGHLKQKPTMLIIGDPFQRIFGFNGASCDFLIHPQQHFGQLCHNPTFVTKHLSICWRITHEMAGFINSHLNPCNLQYAIPGQWWDDNGDRISAWWGKGIRANPQRGPQPDSVSFIRGWGSREAVRKTKNMFRRFGNDEVALIAFSLKGVKTPIRAIVDQLGQGDDENWAVLQGSNNSSAEVLQGKRVASTVHRMKGLERRGIVVCGMDAFIEKLYPHDPLEHFNIWYVACTRAKDQLVVNVTGTDYATVRCCPTMDIRTTRQTCEVSQLVEYVPFDDLLSVPENLFDACVHAEIPDQALALDRQACLVEGRAAGTVEDLTPFLSRAISFKLMLKIHKRLFEIPVEAFTHQTKFDDDMITFITKFYRTPPEQVTWPNLVKYAVAYETMKSRYKHIWRQLDDYEYITPVELLETCTNNAFTLMWRHALEAKMVSGHIFDESQKEVLLASLIQFEVPVSIPFYTPWFTKSYLGQISGVADMMFNGNTIIGIECSNSVPAERGLELTLYAAMESLLRHQECHTMMILTNTAQLVTINLKLKPSEPSVPLTYELIHRAARRKMQLEPASKTVLLRDFKGEVDDAGSVRSWLTPRPAVPQMF